jgi:AcrR family transcriptional regulator
MSKGAQTRERILVRAFRLASRDGLEGLSLSALASESGLSKSGLFAHFGSKEELQVELLRLAAEHFEQVVWGPALRAPRGEPRIRQLFDGWLAWADDPESPGGCIFTAAGAELDDREGRPREFLVDNQNRLHDAIARSAKIAVEVGHFRADLDPEGFGFELYGILLAYNHYLRLLRDAQASTRARAAFERLLATARA